MTNNTENMTKIKKENKKAGGWFIVIMIAAFFVGVILGIVSGVIGDNFDVGMIAKGIYDFARTYSPLMMAAFALVFLTIGFIEYGKGKRLFKKWDGEDEDTIEKAEAYISIALMISSVTLIVVYFLAGVSFASDAVFNFNGFWGMINPILWFGSMVLTLVFVTVLQKKAVDLTKQINPEKNGSVYDMKFQKKWEESCDEAELIQIGKASRASFKAVNSACLTIWMALFFIDMIWRTGIMPMVVVCAIWLVSVISYYSAAAKLAKKSGKK